MCGVVCLTWSVCVYAIALCVYRCTCACVPIRGGDIFIPVCCRSRFLPLWKKCSFVYICVHIIRLVMYVQWHIQDGCVCACTCVCIYKCVCAIICVYVHMCVCMYKCACAICDRIWENPPYGIRARFAQCAFLVAQVEICQSPNFVIYIWVNPGQFNTKKWRPL